VCGLATNKSVQIEISPPNVNVSLYYIDAYRVVLTPLNLEYDQSGQLTVPYGNSAVSGVYDNATSGVTYEISVYSIVPGAESQPQLINCTAGRTEKERDWKLIERQGAIDLEI